MYKGALINTSVTFLPWKCLNDLGFKLLLMKRYIYLIPVFCLYTLTSIAGTPQKIYPWSLQQHSLSHYEEQAELWQQQTQQQPQDKQAWFNYFMANYILSQQTQQVPVTLNSTYLYLQENFSTSFEAYFSDYCQNKTLASLLQAHHTAPERLECYVPLLEHYEQTQATTAAKDLVKRWLDSEQYSTGLLHWHYNALVGLDNNAILLTDGSNYTYPIWLLQYGMGFRNDVQMLNLNLLEESSYRAAKFSQLKITPLADNDPTAILNHLIQQLDQRPFYVSLGVPKQFIEAQENNWYLVGLTFKHSTKSFDNMSTLVEDYEQHFMLDYLKLNLAPDLSRSIVTQQNVNYLPAFLLLYEHYNYKKSYKKAIELKQLCYDIAKKAKKETALNNYFDRGKEVPIDFEPAVELSHKNIEEKFVALPHHLNLYAGATEVSQSDYELFLTDLLKRKNYDLLQKCKIYKTDWRSLLEEQFQDLPDEKVFAFGHPDDEGCPIQNISYEAAQAYCDWLTKVYNNIDHKKKRFQKVKFRLPTEKEWIEAVACKSPSLNQTAVLQENHSKRYPWQGPNYTNAKGCLLGNFNTTKSALKDKYKADKLAQYSAFFTVSVDAYFPNDNGMYNTVGNVAEMIQEKGKAKGGSWAHVPEECTIQAIQTYDAPAPYLGFRVFMEALEVGTVDNVKKGHNGPPGTLHLQGNLYMDITEITKVNWREYLFWLKGNAPEDYKQALPNINVWEEFDKNYKTYDQLFWDQLSYPERPIIGITHEQASAYCEWRTKVVNEMLALNINQQKKFGKVLYRLPTELEWEYAAAGGLNPSKYPYGVFDIEQHKGKWQMPFNWYGVGTVGKSVPLAPASDFNANARGYHNMIGNVAEMVAQKGIAKGGSWFHGAEKSTVKQVQTYQKALPWLGFRCICETNL